VQCSSSSPQCDTNNDDRGLRSNHISSIGAAEADESAGMMPAASLPAELDGDDVLVDDVTKRCHNNARRSSSEGNKRLSSYSSGETSSTSSDSDEAPEAATVAVTKPNAPKNAAAAAAGGGSKTVRGRGAGGAEAGPGRGPAAAGSAGLGSKRSSNIGAASSSAMPALNLSSSDVRMESSTMSLDDPSAPSTSRLMRVGHSNCIIRMMVCCRCAAAGKCLHDPQCQSPCGPQGGCCMAGTP
jgi:hypothetical protein